MDFEYSEEQTMLARTVADFAAKESPLSRARKLRDDARGWSGDVWRKMGELGWLSVPFPEAVGGYGGTFLDAAVVLEELAKTLVPEPYMASVVLGGYALLLGGDRRQREAYLAPMLAGESSLALAWAESGGRYDMESPAARAVKHGGGYRLHGRKVWVLNGHAADRLIVSARAGKDAGLFIVPRAAPGLQCTAVATIDGRRAAMIDLDGVEVPAGDRLQAAPAAVVLRRLFDYGAAAAVSEALGVCQQMLEMTVAYLNTREQFDVKIGTFQALQHRAVDMFVETQLLKSAALAAVLRADENEIPERVKAISAAKFQLATGGKFVSRQAIQLHGGIGVTDEHDVGLYFKRIEVLANLFGDEAFHTRRFAEASR